jgi:signal peptidase I
MSPRFRFALNLLVAFVVAGLIQSFVVKLYRVPSGSMEPTLQGSASGGDRILVNRLAYLGGSPEAGDVVVFTRPATWQPGATNDDGALGSALRAFGDLTGIGQGSELYLVKRVAARGGQTISCCDAQGRVQRNGVALDEPYVAKDLPFEPGHLDCVTATRSFRCFGPFTVPDGELVVLGDHRSASADSVIACRAATRATEQCVRTVPVGAVVGRVEARLWPLGRIGLLA